MATPTKRTNTNSSTMKVTKQTQARALSARVLREPPKLRLTPGVRRAAMRTNAHGR